ncbi:hypothetical protein FE257_003292 [Aspergillus nanangensis]|uniref:N,O-diacetylmuramidase n=1 Tax=Aspergillus nanangensis TaxID=2582783 RepID=A0AAD4CSA8_ASPNN|nr:hypothetical protein FE257_003292 [Aspergillus nanangensis]
MKGIFSLLACAGLAQATVQGFDISHWQTSVNYAGAYGAGARFATEGTTYTDPSFSTHYTGATNAGLIRGGYHFALPDSTSGAAQAKYFLAHGGGWTGDGITLPGMLDIEYNPYGATCYGLSAASMVSWISDFVETYKSAVGRYPMIYTTTDWWTTCTGNSKSFTDCPLVLARYSSSVGTIPGGWPYQSIWQNSDSYSYGGDSDIWNGDAAGLKRFATG